MAAGKCSHCGRAFGKHAKFCQQCGRSVNVDTEAPSVPDPKPLTDEVLDEIAREDADESASSDCKEPASDVPGARETPAAPAPHGRHVLEVQRMGADASDAGGERIELVPGKALHIGAAPAADVCLDTDPYASRRHAVIEVRDSTAFIRDAGSSNGTFLQVTNERELRDGDLVLIGRTRLRVHYEE